MSTHYQIPAEPDAVVPKVYLQTAKHLLRLNLSSKSVKGGLRGMQLMMQDATYDARCNLSCKMHVQIDGLTSPN
jgi:hypothetical protein